MLQIVNRLQLKRAFIRIQNLATRAVKSKPEPKFTQSAAFQGRGAPKFQNAHEYGSDYYNSDIYNNMKIFSALGSLAVLVAYFGWIREPSDLDEIWNTPPHILTANLERRMIREQIKEAEAKGMDTALLKAQLEYVDVKEEALRIQFEQKSKQEERRKHRVEQRTP